MFVLVQSAEGRGVVAVAKEASDWIVDKDVRTGRIDWQLAAAPDSATAKIRAAWSVRSVRSPGPPARPGSPKRSDRDSRRGRASYVIEFCPRKTGADGLGNVAVDATDRLPYYSNRSVATCE